MIKLGKILKEIKVVKPDVPKRNTILWWFYQLPEPYRTQALTNYKNETDEEFLIYKNNECKSLYKALMYAFNWFSSPEGYDYWNDIYDKLENNEPLNEIKVLKPNPFKPKSIGWWLFQLPEPYHTKALTNYKNEKNDRWLHYRNHQYETTEEALNFSFNWDKTPEGINYWDNLYKKLENNEPLKEIKVLKPNPYKPKTPEWWLYQLPEPYRIQALTNFKNQPNYDNLKNKIYNNLLDALRFPLIWFGSTEGWDYWENLYFKIENNEQLNEIKVVKPNPFEQYTPGWWIYQLPQPYRSQALNNYRNYTDNLKIKNKKFTTAWEGLLEAFNWDNTPEGYDYWDNIYDKLDNDGTLNLNEIKVLKPVGIKFEERTKTSGIVIFGKFNIRYSIHNNDSIFIWVGSNEELMDEFSNYKKNKKEWNKENGINDEDYIPIEDSKETCEKLLPYFRKWEPKILQDSDDISFISILYNIVKDDIISDFPKYIGNNTFEWKGKKITYKKDLASKDFYDVYDENNNKIESGKIWYPLKQSTQKYMEFFQKEGSSTLNKMYPASIFNKIFNKK